MSHFIAYAWIVTLLVAIGLSAWRGLPVLNVLLMPISDYPGLYFSIGMMAVACFLMALQFLTNELLFGQQPIYLACLVALIYYWPAVLYRLSKP